MSDLKDPNQVDRDKWKTAIQKANQLEVEDRREQVQGLRLQGHSIRSIADLTGSSRATVQRDLEHIKNSNASRVDETESNIVVAEALSYYHALETEAWASYRAAKEGSSQAIKALDLIRVIQGDKVKALRDTGFIKTGPAQVEVQVHHKLEQVVTPELMAEISMSLLQKGLTTQLPEPIPQEDVMEAEIVEEGEIQESTDE